MTISLNLLKHFNKILSIAIILFIFQIKSNELKAQHLEQEIDKKLVQKFLATNELYLINSPVSNVSFTTKSGRNFTFEQLVQENWPSKKIIKIDEKDYNKLKDLSQKFYITITTWDINPREGNHRGTTDGIFLQKGKTGLGYSYLFWLQIPLNEYLKGIAPERFIYSMANFKYMLENDKDKNSESPVYYKTIGYKESLKSDTLYVKKDDLDGLSNTPEILKKFYPYNFKIVNQDQWLKIITEPRPNVLFVDYVRGGGAAYYNSANIYQAKNGKLIVASYPWKGFGHTMGKAEFKKIAQ